MNGLRRLALGILLSAPLALFAQPHTAPAEAPEEKGGWEFAASAYGYFPPDDRIYGQPTVLADHGALHLEGRYNYESLDTGSVWVGWNFGFGEALRLDATLMAGGVFGDTRGAAPGYHLTVSWGRFELYSEGEYVVDADDSRDNFFYNWSQLGFSPLEWLSVGLATQRTRVYRTGLDVQRGVFVALSREHLRLAAYVFNLGWESPTVVTALEVSF
jgi:hypothetical protein